MLVVGVLLLVMLLLLVVEAKGPLVLAMLMGKDMLRHALMLKHNGEDRCRRQLLFDAEIVVGG